MNKILERFGKPRVLLPVVHCIDSAQTKKQARLAVEHGADGVFLINQGGLSERSVMLDALWLAQNGVPFVGVNLLGRGIDTALRWCGDSYIAAIWTDNPGTPEEVGAFCRQRSAARQSTALFGGVAFKYQPRVADVGAAAATAAGAGVDVVTTSGPGTGEPPTVEKVATMRQTLGDHALAIASGITPENVGAFLPHVDAYLVATGIEASFGVFDPARVRALADAIHGWRA